MVSQWPNLCDGISVHFSSLIASDTLLSFNMFSDMLLLLLLNNNKAKYVSFVCNAIFYDRGFGFWPQHTSWVFYQTFF